MSIHDFDERLAFSHDQSNQDWWEIVYRQAFPDMAAMVDLRHDGWHQRAGRDRGIVLSTGRTVYVDEKVRSEAYADIALEIWSQYPKGARPPGWMVSATSRSGGFRWVVAENGRYLSISIAVPLDVLRAAVTDAMTVTWAASKEAA